MQDRAGKDTIIHVSAHAFMVVGLKYVGASDEFPTRIAVGDVVNLRREPCNPPDSGAVAAYYDGRKIGYLSSEKEALWDTLRPSARRRAKVMGEILDEDGNLAGLDIEIGAAAGRHEQPSALAAADGEKAPGRGKTLGITAGLAVLFLVLMADADGTAPVDPAVIGMRPDALALVDRVPAMNDSERVKYQDRSERFAQVVKPTPSDQFLSMVNSRPSLEPTHVVDSRAEQMQAQELRRIIQRASAHRLAKDLQRRAEVALLLQQAEVQKAQRLAEDLQQAREESARQRLRFEELERQTRETATLWRAENGRLVGEVAQLQRRIEQMTLARQQLEQEQRNLLAMQELNQDELVRHENRLAAWTLINRRAQTQVAEKTGRALRQMPGEPARAVVVVPVPTDKPGKKRKRTNFSRYAQENRGAD